MTHLPRRTHYPLLILLFQILFSAIAFGSVLREEGEEEFSEELLLRPLPDRKVLAHFHFESRAPPSLSDSHGRHHHLFPKAIAQLVQKFRVKEMELSFTQGRWNYDRWGGFDPIPSSNAKPPGVELWAVFDVPQYQVDASWKNLTHTLSGLFCASINFLESSTTYSAPEWSFQPSTGSLRYGTLPREAVCTENLTPWLKLLPCRDKSGLSTLMHRPSIYRGFYHSQRLRLTSSQFDSGVLESGIVLEQTLTVVLQPNSQSASKTYSIETKLQPSWSLSSIFGRKVTGRCVLAKSSNVYLQLERGLVTELENLQKENVISRADIIASFASRETRREKVMLLEGSNFSNGNLGLGSLCSKQGSKGVNQDAAILYQGYGAEDGVLCGVFDGHGKNGHTVSKLVNNRLPSLILSQKKALAQINAVDDNGNFQNHVERIEGEFIIPSKSFHIWKEACVDAFKVMDKEIKLQENLDCSCSGAAAVVVIKQGEDLVIANLGDSRAILGTITDNGVVAIQLTTDLKPGLPCEAERIRKCNGRVGALKQEPHIQRVWLPNNDSPGLAMSRAFGDFILKDHGIIAIPDIYYRRLNSNDQFILLATDGVWDVLSNDQVASIVWAADSEQAAARMVVEAATTAWKRYPSAKVDDCSVVCLFLQKKRHVFMPSKGT